MIPAQTINASGSHIRYERSLALDDEHLLCSIAIRMAGTVPFSRKQTIWMTKAKSKSPMSSEIAISHSKPASIDMCAAFSIRSRRKHEIRSENPVGAAPKSCEIDVIGIVEPDRPCYQG